MNDSVWTDSVVVGGEVAAGVARVPVVPKAGGEGEQALGNAGDQAGHRVGAVALERELALERVDDRLDPLADAAQSAEAAGLVLAVGAQEERTERGHQRLEVLAREALVGDHGVAVELNASEHLGRDLALGGVGRSE